MAEKQENEQLSFELKEPFINKLYKIKNRLFFTIKILEGKKFLRSGFVWFFIIATLSEIFVQIYYIEKYFSVISNEIPLLKMYVSPSLKIASKEGLILIPIISTLVLLISIYFSARTYRTRKNLSITTLFVTFASIAIITYTLLKLISIFYV